MGAFEALENTIEFVIAAIVLGAFITGSWATINLYYGNTDVFAFSVVMLVLFGMIPLIFIVGGLMLALRSFRKKREQAQAQSLFNREEE